MAAWCLERTRGFAKSVYGRENAQESPFYVRFIYLGYKIRIISDHLDGFRSAFGLFPSALAALGL
jgi:hypothetical protein